MDIGRHTVQQKLPKKPNAIGDQGNLTLASTWTTHWGGHAGPIMASRFTCSSTLDFVVQVDRLDRGMATIDRHAYPRHKTGFVR